KIITKFEKDTGKKISEISEDVFSENLPLDFNMTQGIAFNEKANQLFYSYHIKYLNEKLKGHNEKEIRAILNEPPWETLNKDLNKIGFQYQFTFPTGTNLLAPFQLQLKHNKNNVILNFSDLSGGERVIMSLVFWS